jgi:arsenate reductase (glutaredoxin)
MNKVKIWHNPRCSKSREALAILDEVGCEKEVVKYLEETLTKEDVKAVLKTLGLSARELMRTKEDVYEELNLKDERDEEKLVEAMAQNPKLIQRPIVIKGDKAIIGRPASLIKEFLDD